MRKPGRLTPEELASAQLDRTTLRRAWGFARVYRRLLLAYLGTIVLAAFAGTLPPLVFKALPVLTAFYIVSPLDFVPDVLPVVGQLDDFALLLVALEGFLRLCPTNIVTFHRGAMAEGRRYSPAPHPGEIIDAEFRRQD